MLCCSFAVLPKSHKAAEKGERGDFLHPEGVRRYVERVKKSQSKAEIKTDKEMNPCP